VASVNRIHPPHRFNILRGPLRVTALTLTAFAGGLLGCSAPSTGPVPNATVAAKQQAKSEAQKQAQAAAHLRDVSRQQLENVPPPSKSLYLAVHSRDAWANPFLMVGRDSINLRMIYPDANGSTLGSGGLLRPASARRQDLEIRLADLPTALAALPENAWPYGRVIAIEEGGTAIKADRAQIRRNVEAAIQTLNDLGVVVDEWTGPNDSLLR